MKQHSYILFLSLFFISHVNGQDSTAIIHDSLNYSPIKAEGIIPSDFIGNYQLKLERDLEKISDDESRRAKKLKEEFYESSNYFMHEMLSSGEVIFGGPILEYVNKVMDVVLADEPKLRSEVRIYLIKTPMVNATTTDNGVIFINVGLLAKLDNEAQLAYILSHEVIHYRNKHVVDGFIEKDKINNRQDLYTTATSFEKKLYAYSSYSKELELESDELGFKDYFSKTKYSLDAVDGTLDALMYSYLPYEDTKFDKRFFESGSFKFPKNYSLNELKKISATEEYNDTISSHPNIKKRRENLVDIITEYDSTNRQDFIVSEKDFLSIREIARAEIVSLYINELNYVDAIYNAYLLSKKYPNNKYLETSIVHALVLATIYKNQEKYDNITDSYYKIEGQQQQLYYLIESLTKEQLNALAVRESWELYKKYPDDNFISSLKDYAFNELAIENELGPKDFIFEKPIIKTDTTVKAKPDSINTTEADTVKKEKLSRYERIKLKKLAANPIEGGREVNPIKNKKEEFYKYAFIDFANDEEFMKEFEISFKEAERRRKTNKIVSYDFTNFSNKQLALGIDKIIIISPRFLKINSILSGYKPRYKKTLNRIDDIHNMIDISAKAAKLEYEFLSPLRLDSSNIERYNDLNIIKHWIEESNTHEFDVPLKSNETIKPIIEKYDTKYIGWHGMITQGPFLLGNHNTLYFFFLFNMETREVDMVEFYSYPQKDSGDYLKSRLYNTFIQIKQEPKNSNENGFY